MKELKNKKSLLLGGALCLSFATLAITIAYNHDSSTIPNEFSVGQYRTVFTEQFTSPNNWKPCDETAKTFTVKNETGTDIKVRIKYDEVWRNAADTKNLPLTKDNITLANVVLQNTNDWELKGDGYYYYKNALAPDAATSSLFQKVVLDCNADFGADNTCAETTTGTVCTKPNDDYEGAKYHLRIKVETIEANDAEDEWGFALLDTGKNVRQALKCLAENSSVAPFTPDNTIKSIAIVDVLPDTIDLSTAAKTDLALTNTDPIYAYFDGTDSIYIHADGRTLYANEDSSHMFYEMEALTSLTLPDSFNTSRVTNMYYMFYNVKALTSLTLPDSFNTTNVGDMRGMFSGMEALTSLTLPDSFDTSNVEIMNAMFNNVKALTSLTLPDSFKTPSVTRMIYMFNGMEALTSLTLPDGFDTSNVENMEGMFNNMKALTSLTLPDSFNTTNVGVMGGMFSGMEALTSLTLPDSFNTSRVTNMYEMFYNVKALTSLTLPDSFNTTNVENMERMFSGMKALTSLTLPASFVINSGTRTTGIFGYISSTAALNSTADQSVKALWSPRPFSN